MGSVLGRDAAGAQQSLGASHVHVGHDFKGFQIECRSEGAAAHTALEWRLPTEKEERDADGS